MVFCNWGLAGGSASRACLPCPFSTPLSLPPALHCPKRTGPRHIPTHLSLADDSAKMSRWSLLALLLGVLLVAAPFAKHSRFAHADEYDDEEGDEEGGGAADDEEKDVVVLTTKNWDSIVKPSKFALVE